MGFKNSVLVKKETKRCLSRHLGSLTAANWVPFDFNVSYSSLINCGGQQGDGLETIRFAVTVHVYIGRVCARHLDCRVVGICDDIFISSSVQSLVVCG